MKKKLIGFIIALMSLTLCAGCFGSGTESSDSQSSSNSIESEQSGNSSSDITDDSSSDDSSSDDSSSDDSSSDDSSSDDSSSDDSSSDDSSSDDSSSDDSSSNDSSSDDSSSDDSSSDDSSSDDSSSGDSSGDVDEVYYTVSFVDAFNNKTTVEYVSGATLQIPEVGERQGYAFLGWAELIGEDTYTEPGEITDLTVTSNREFVAMFNAVGPTYEKPAIGTNIYTANDREIGVNEESKLVLNTEKGAVFFEDAEVQQGQSYVVYATLNSLDNTPDGVGFTVGTLADGNAQHAMFLWRESDIYVVRMANGEEWAWAGEISQSCSKSHSAATLTLVYDDGYYYMFIDGAKVFVCSETAVYQGLSAPIQDMVGTEGTIKVGLASLSADATFTDWGYSTDATIIEQYVGVQSAEVENFACNIEPEEEGQFNNNAEASNINPHFEVEATFNGGDENGLIGFAFTAEDGKVMRFAYDKVKGRFGFMADESGWDHFREYALETDVYNAEGANTIKVVYNGNRIFEVYMNGTKMVATDGRQGQFYLGWNCRGTAADSSLTDMKPYQMWGSSTIDSRATLTISAYASDAATVISGFSCAVIGGYVPGETPEIPDNPDNPEPPVVEPDENPVSEVSNFACNIEPEEEGQFNNNAEASNINPHFEVEATFNGGDENGLIGFAFTAEDGKVMRFAYDKVKGRFGFMDGESGWDHFREYALETDVYNAEGANTIKVVYNGNRIFEVYMNGTKMVATDGRQGQFYLGWNCRGTAADSSMTDMKPYQMWGSSTIDSRATLTISAYASDAATVISGFSCEVTGGYVPGETPEIPDNPDDPEPPVVEPEIKTSAEVSNFACNIAPEEEGQFNNNAEASNINPHFEVEATFNGGDENGLIGFAFTAEDGKVMRFAYDKVKGRFGFMAGESGWDHFREYALETDVYNAEGANTIKVIYNGNRIFEVYMNGTKMVATDGRQGQFYLGWNCRGTAADSSLTDMKPYQMWGSSTIDSRATLTISAYASDAATVISGFSCEVTGGYVPEENPGDIVEPEIKTSAEVSNFACNIEPEEDGQFNNNAEASNINPHFEVEATFNGGDENGLIGFAFTAEDGKVMRFAYDKVKGRFGFMAGESGWDHYREYALETDVYNAEGANTIKVVYNGNRIFEVYMNGTKMVATDGRQGQFYLGWNCRGTAGDSSLTDMKPYQMWGSSTIDSRATLTISAYASDEATEITNFTCTVTGGYGYQEN